jgi:hypothetical protein
MLKSIFNKTFHESVDGHEMIPVFYSICLPAKEQSVVFGRSLVAAREKQYGNIGQGAVFYDFFRWSIIRRFG